MKDNLVFFISILLLCSCGSQEDKLISNEQNVLNFIHSNFPKYQYIYEEALQELEYLKNSNIKMGVSLKFGEWKMDSLIIFNKSETVFISSLITKNRRKDYPVDNVSRIIGYRINGSWKLYLAGSYEFPRFPYQKQIYDNPVDFETLAFLSHQNVLKPFYKITRGHLEYNFDNFWKEYNLKRMFNVFDKSFSQKKIDSLWISMYQQNYNIMLDQEKIDERMDTYFNAKPKPEPDIDEGRIKMIESHQRIMKALYPDKYDLATKH